MCGVVVRVGRVVISLDNLEPGFQRSLRAVQKLTHTKAGKDLQSEVGERSGNERQTCMYILSIAITMRS